MLRRLLIPVLFALTLGACHAQAPVNVAHAPFAEHHLGSTVNSSILAVSNLAGGGPVGPAVSTVDVASIITINQTTAAQTIILPSPTDNAIGHEVLIINIGSATFTMGTFVVGSLSNISSSIRMTWNGAAWSKQG